jgi:hypothetical protein
MLHVPLGANHVEIIVTCAWLNLRAEVKPLAVKHGFIGSILQTPIPTQTIFAVPTDGAFSHCH